MSPLEQARYDRGKIEAKAGLPPTEGSPEYREGYAAGLKELEDTNPP